MKLKDLHELITKVLIEDLGRGDLEVVDYEDNSRFELYLYDKDHQVATYLEDLLSQDLTHHEPPC